MRMFSKCCACDLAIESDAVMRSTSLAISSRVASALHTVNDKTRIAINN